MSSNVRDIVGFVTGYIVIYAANHYLLHQYNLPFYVAPLFVGAVLVCDLLATLNPAFTAYIMAHRHYIAGAVMLVSLLLGTGALVTSAPVNYSVLVLSQFTLQGFVVGVVVRTLILTVAVRFLNGSQVEVHKLLLLLALTIFLWLFPFLESHRLYAGFYLYGFGIGFCLHYLVRNREHRRAQTMRHGRHILELLGGTNLILKGVEFQAVSYYANHKWRKLHDLLLRNEHQPTTVLAILKASYQRIHGDYAEARATIEIELDRPDHDHSLEKFLYLQMALSLGDLSLEHLMVEALDQARTLDPQCLLTLITTGVRIAEQLHFDGEPDYETEGDKREAALEYIWDALKLNERLEPELMSRIVGRAVPVTLTFLLDSYAYVLLKAGHDKLSRALLTQCLVYDPYFSSPYLHLGEWYVAHILKAKALASHTNDEVKKAELLASVNRYRRVAPLCLHVALQLERRDSRIKRRATAMLDRYLQVLLSAE